MEKDALHYRLPMDYDEAIERFSLKATVWRSAEKPQLTGGLSNELKFDAESNNYTASFVRRNYAANKPLEFSLPVPANIPRTLMQSASGSYYFVALYAPKTDTPPKKWGNRLGIIWDVSMSGLQRNIKKELELLDIIIKEKINLSVTVYLLNNKFTNAGTFQITQGNWENLRNTLETAVYDGGTDYSTVRIPNSDFDELILFSDGLSTLSDASIAGLNRQLHCVVSSPRADYSALRLLASQNGGKFINLNALSPAGLYRELTTETLYFLGVEKPASVREVYPSIPVPVDGNFSVAGILDASSANITLLFGYGGKVQTKTAVKLQSNSADRQGFVHRIWAQKKINELDMQYDKNRDELTQLGQQFGIVTRNTSLIVLETLQDYLTYDITPPEDMREEYMLRRKNIESTRLRTQQNLLNNAIIIADDLKEWWNTDFKPVKPKYPEPDKKLEIAVVEEEAEEITVGDVQMSQNKEATVDFSEESMDEVTVVAFGTRRDAANVASEQKRIAPTQRHANEPVIKIVPVRQDNDYAGLFTGISSDDYRKYLEIRSEYINTPTFFFNVADLFFKNGDREKAIRILTSIADMELENASLFRLLGYRLKEYGEYDSEEYVCKKVIQWRPMEPQSYRDYALALADGGKYQEAVNSLYSVLTQSYSGNIINSNAGMEEVVITELNNLISGSNADYSFIDSHLVYNMPVDIRVVINWNMNNTDIDLHVKDPGQETCYYSNRRTKIGGRISADMTSGYGPEQFMLKKAVKGVYEVFVNYFGDSQVKAEGPSTVMIEIFTDYADKTRKRQVVCVQLSGNEKANNQGLLKIAEFRF
jgi:tetratricopeptide (TPR) repeat protein